MSLGRKTLLIATLALAGLGGLLYAAMTNILSTGVEEEMVISYVTVSVIVAGGGFFLVTLLLMNQLVLTRLARLNATISAMSASGDFSRRLQIDGRDELAGLALEINALLRALQESRSASVTSVASVLSVVTPPDSQPTSSEAPDDLSVSDSLHGHLEDSSPNAAEELFAQLFHSLPFALAVCSAEDQRLREFNDHFLNLIGSSRDKLLGRTLAELEIWTDAPEREHWLRLLDSQQSVREFQCRFRTPAGGVRDTLGFLEWLQVGAERLFVFAACDITGHINQEVQLRHNQKTEAMGQLAAGFAHDFNNLLAIVQGYTSILLSSQGLDGQATKALKEVAAAAERAANLTRQLLTFSRKQFMQPKTLDLNRLLQGLESTLQRLLGESSVLKFNLSPAAPLVRADSGMLEQLIVNLAVNARECMPRGGELAIQTAAVDLAPNDLRQKTEAQPGRFACVTVTDTGCGFEPSTLNRIFEPFFSSKGAGKGTGMGLATAFAIVKQHHGWIDVTSQPGQGATFKIFLPSEIKAASAPKPPPPGAPGGKEKILLVEDEPGLCAMVEGILRRYGYKVFTAPNGIQAIQLWKQQKAEFDLLLTDMVMPEGLTGRQLAEKLKAQNPALKVIYSSGYSVDLVTEEGMELTEGLNFLQKPYHPQKLAQTVRACLDSAAKPALAAA